MEHQPLRTVDDDFAAEHACAVCGETALAVIHVENLPDYVKCKRCDSAFILNDAGDWAMFGAISSDYPETKQMALKRWTTLEAVQAMASSERTLETSIESTDRVSDSTPPFGLNGESIPSEKATTPPFGIEELDGFVAEGSNGNSVSSPTIKEPILAAADGAEPEPGQRYVVTLAQKTATMPEEQCAHCLRQPAPRKLVVTVGSNFEYSVPLCQSCHERASAQTEEQKMSKLVAHLSSILIAGVLTVGVLAVGIINMRELGMLDLLLLGTIGLAGYGLSAFLLLGRSSRLQPSEDAEFVRSTLRLRDNEGLAFGWRNRGYAELFATANTDLQLGELAQVFEDRT